MISPPREFLEDLQYHWFEYMPQTMDYHGFFDILFAVFGVTFIYVSVKLPNMFGKQFVNRLQYNAKRDLLFADTVDMYGNDKTLIYEVDHLEQSIPNLKVGSHYKDFSQKGLTTIRCLNKFQNIAVFNDDKYWKKGEKGKLFSRITNLVDKEYVEKGIHL